MTPMTEKQWMELARVALLAATLTLRKESGEAERNAVADYCESIRDQVPVREGG